MQLMVFDSVVCLLVMVVPCPINRKYVNIDLLLHYLIDHDLNNFCCSGCMLNKVLAINSASNCHFLDFQIQLASKIKDEGFIPVICYKCVLLYWLSRND